MLGKKIGSKFLKVSNSTINKFLAMCQTHNNICSDSFLHLNFPAIKALNMFFMV